ncbi:MAG TPA: hypothetical protein VN864_07425 [Thermoplasmata archaeon]|nr:hypothetical protein [Thermoplasmata archaeon]
MRSDEVKQGFGSGVRIIEKGESPGTIAYLTVMNIDESLHAAQKEGAKVVMPKKEIPGVGWHAIIHAPGNVMVGLYQGQMPK